MYATLQLGNNQNVLKQNYTYIVQSICTVANVEQAQCAFYTVICCINTNILGNKHVCLIVLLEM